MKTEQVTLTVVHDEKDRLGSASGWEWQTMVDATIGQDSESPVEVRVVEQPRGWLTEHERRMLANALSTCRVEAKHSYRSGDERAADGYADEALAIESILARSTPPKVDLPISLSLIDEELIRAALAAAGVAVKEVE